MKLLNAPQFAENGEFGENPRSSSAFGLRRNVTVKVTRTPSRSIHVGINISEEELAQFFMSDSAQTAATGTSPSNETDEVTVVVHDNRAVLPSNLNVIRACVLDTVRRHDKNQRPQVAMEFIAEYLDDLLNADNFRECAAILNEARPEEFSDPVIVAFLGVTLAAKDKLGRSRAAFFEKAMQAVTSRRDKAAAHRLLGPYR
jgi:hypothetical protein